MFDSQCALMVDANGGSSKTVGTVTRGSSSDRTESQDLAMVRGTDMELIKEKEIDEEMEECRPERGERAK